MLQDALQQRVGDDNFVPQQLNLSEMQIADYVRIDIADSRIHL